MAHPFIEPFPLPPGEIHLWRLPLDRSTPTAAPLTDADRRRMARIRNPRPRHRWACARALTRLILAGYLNRNPTALALCTAPGGKPMLADGALTFNLTHSGAVALLAVARDRALGVDLERVRPVVHMARIAARLFDDHARQALAQIPEPSRTTLFFDHWTRMEARQKCSGSGLFGPPTAPDGLLAFEPEPGWRAALAWHPAGERPPVIRFFQWRNQTGKLALLHYEGPPTWS